MLQLLPRLIDLTKPFRIRKDRCEVCELSRFLTREAFFSCFSGERLDGSRSRSSCWRLSSGFYPRDNDLNWEDICCWWLGALLPDTLTLYILALLANFGLRLTLTGSIGYTCGLFRLLPMRFRFRFSVTRLDSSFLWYWMVCYWPPRSGLTAEPRFTL